MFQSLYERLFLKVLYLVNSSVFFCSHFITLAQAVLEQGHEVFIAAGDNERQCELEQKGFQFISIRLSRKGKNVFSELSSLIDLYKVIRLVKPEIMHAFTIKPIIYSSLINKVLSSKQVPLNVASITGLGSASLATNFRGKLLWYFLRNIYKFVLSTPSTKVIFENNDDLNQFVQSDIVSSTQVFIVNGAGVDTSIFSPAMSKCLKTLKVVLVARLLKDKGIREYIEAGKLIKKRGVNAQLQLVGSIDDNNISSMSYLEVKRAHDQGYVDYLGQRNDISSIYKKSDVACLPSYREGLPKSLIEAAACGLAIITTNVPGCRQMIFNGENGILIEPKNAKSIANEIDKLSNNPELVYKMGLVSRKKAIELFDHTTINQSFFKIYGLPIVRC